MSYIDFSPASFLAFLGVIHVVNLLLTWLTHFLQHQTILGIPLYRIHLKAHHEIDRRRLTARDHLRMAAGYGLWSTLVVAGATLQCLFLPTWMAVTFVADAALIILFAYVVHREYDRPFSRLDRFEWFRRGRALHKIHHTYFGEEFSRSRNYAFGGPFAGNFTDYLMGTFQGQGVEGTGYAPRPAQLADSRGNL